MKLTRLALILVLSSNIYTVNGQEQSKQLDEATRVKIQKLRELEAQLNSLPASAKVKTKGDDSSITIEWKETLVETASNEDNKSKTQTKSLDIKLSELDVPDEYIDEIVKAAPLEQSNCGELPGVTLRQIGITPKYELREDYEYPGDGYTISVVRPFVYDRASIPSIFWILRLDKDSVGNVAPLIHDYLYRHGGELPQNQVKPKYRKFSRDDADKIFRDALKRCGVPRWKYEVAYAAVSVAGESSWQGKVIN